MSPAELAASLKSRAREAGAELVGIAPAANDSADGPAYEAWLAAGMHGEMDYMARNAHQRRDIRAWMEDAKSVLMCGFSYGSKRPSDNARKCPHSSLGCGRLARYAVRTDYHAVLRKRMNDVGDWLAAAVPGARGVAFCDMSPILERSYARAAGLGWQGKNTMMIGPKLGSYFLLAGLAINRDLPADSPQRGHCGTCRKCLDACPTDAFPRAHVLDASKCIAYFTIERKGPIPEGFRAGVGDWVYGCDVCQEVCPWNRFETPARVFANGKVATEIPLEELAGPASTGVRARLKGLPVARAVRKRLTRNALLAMGNSGLARYRPILEHFAAAADPVLSEQARWSLDAIRSSSAASVPGPKGPGLDAIGRAVLTLLLLWPLAAAGALREDAGSTEIVPQRGFPKGVREAPKQDDTHAVVRWMIKPLRRGMFIRLPVIDTDPNRGVTGGVMPIWVLQGENDDRIEQIHAPSLTYNKTFKIVPTYRYYYYPHEDASLLVLASWSQYEREAFGEYSDGGIFGTEHDIVLRAQYTVDAGQRFYGFGPDSAKSAEANYTEDYWQYRWGVGTPIVKGGNWRAYLAQHYQSSRILDGPDNRTRFPVAFPNQFSDAHQQASESRVTLNYDDRDHGVTTERGTYFETFAEVSRRGFMSSYDYERYGVDYRWFKPWATDKVSAVQAKYEQLIGLAPPFWLMPRLGGKYSLRSYGAGRYTDRAAAVVNVEQRFKMFEKKVGGVTTEFQLAPFVGAGTVFDNPNRAAAKYVRPAVGAAVRAVAKPQVIGSLDFGVGREGLAVFMDINYSF